MSIRTLFFLAQLNPEFAGLVALSYTISIDCHFTADYCRCIKRTLLVVAQLNAELQVLLLSSVPSLQSRLPLHR